MQECITSDELLDLRRIPPSIIVLGGGAVALESAHYLNALGSRVTIIQRNPQLLRGTDDDVAEVVENVFRKRGMEIFAGHQNPAASSATRKTRRVVFQHQGSEIAIEAAAILNALGREPKISHLGLENAAVKIEGNGHLGECPSTDVNAAYLCRGRLLRPIRSRSYRHRTGRARCAQCGPPPRRRCRLWNQWIIG